MTGTMLANLTAEQIMGSIDRLIHIQHRFFSWAPGRGNEHPCSEHPIHDNLQHFLNGDFVTVFIFDDIVVLAKPTVPIRK